MQLMRRHLTAFLLCVAGCALAILLWVAYSTLTIEDEAPANAATSEAL